MAERAIRMVVGLGNPGSRYRNTPHNIGFEVLDTLAEAHGLRFRRAFGLQARGVTWQREGSAIRLLQPQTFMNRSGISVSKALKSWKLEPEDMLLVYDDVELPLGRMRLRASGGAGGHNGVTSVIRELGGTKTFPRLRLGVGPRPPGDQLTDYLLSPWGPEADTEVSALRTGGMKAVERVLSEGLTAAMNHFNSGKPEPRP